MPQTESERLKSGRHQQQQGEEADARTQPKDSVSPQLYARTSVTQCHSEEEGRPFLQQVSRCSQLSQHRPSVLRQGVQAAHVRPKAPRTLTEASSAQPISLCKVKVDAGRQSSPPHSEPSPGPTRHPSPLRAASPKHSSIITRHHEPDHPTLRGSSALFLNGLCCWPGCNAVFEGFPRFLKHLHSDHGHGDRSIAQWRVQQDMVQYMETQLTVEKQKLFAMQLHLHLSGHKSTVLKAGSDWPYSHSLPLGLPQNPTPAQAPDGVPCCATKEPEDWPFAASYHLRPDLVQSVECYKYNNIRPPYTYAYLIRWSILESPDKQRSLNDIYNWFTTMFFYFRHNTATWKNAVRHNLSLHKCFERVEGGKGAVWTVDEMEYQRRKGQKYHRDHHVKWLAPYSLFSPEEL